MAALAKALRNAVAPFLWCTDSPCPECSKNVAAALKRLRADGFDVVAVAKPVAKPRRKGRK